MTSDASGLVGIDCIFCGHGAASDVVIRENGYDGRQCRACGLVYVSPRPRLEAIIDLYGHNEAHVSASSHLAAGYSKRLYARNALGIIRRHAREGDLLEIGAGAGHFLDEARRLGFRPRAIEFNGIQANYIRNTLGLECASQPLSSTPFPGVAFDVIYHCDVISHLYDPIGEFRDMHRALRPGGLLVFETGNIGDIAPRHYALFRKFQYPDHLFFFGRENLARLLEMTGFELVEIHGYAIQLDLLLERSRHRLRRLARRLLRGSSGHEPTGVAQAPGGESSQPPPAPQNRLVAALKRADQYLNFVIRYRVGRWLPKGKRPQTMIIVARRVDDRNQQSEAPTHAA